MTGVVAHLCATCGVAASGASELAGHRVRGHEVETVRLVLRRRGRDYQWSTDWKRKDEAPWASHPSNSSARLT